MIYIIVLKIFKSKITIIKSHLSDFLPGSSLLKTFITINKDTKILLITFNISNTYIPPFDIYKGTVSGPSILYYFDFFFFGKGLISFHIHFPIAFLISTITSRPIKLSASSKGTPNFSLNLLYCLSFF